MNNIARKLKLMKEVERENGDLKRAGKAMAHVVPSFLEIAAFVTAVFWLGSKQKDACNTVIDSVKQAGRSVNNFAETYSAEWQEQMDIENAINGYDELMNM